MSRRGVVLGATGGASLLALEFLFGPAAAAHAATPPLSNGVVPASMLTTVPSNQGTVRLEKNTAAKWLSMVAACKAATGTTMVVTAPDGGYRDLEEQQYRYDHPEGPVQIAKPGGSSHGFGTAIDIWNREYNWLVAHAREFDFTQTFDSEPWHWQYTGSTATVGPEIEDEDMQLIVVIADAGTDRGPIYGSTAVITAHRGFVKTSDGLGPRNELNAWTAIANAVGFTVTEKHVDTNGFLLAQRL